VRYDIEADWQLLNTCNYRCRYCFFGPDRLGEKLQVHAGVEAWAAAFERTGLTWLLNITGGEPTVYPEFAALCAALAERHYLAFNTNLSRPSVLEFADRVDPRRVSLINVGLHPRERIERTGWAAFDTHLRALLAGGFPVLVSVVATPEVLANADMLMRLLDPVGLSPAPKLLRGRWGTRLYPQAYTAEERAAFRAMLALARTRYAGLLRGRDEWPTINPFFDDEYLEGTPRFLGRSCGAGATFVALDPDGSVFRCSRSETLGNLLRGDLRLRGGPAPCDTSYCYYFCRKHTERAAPGDSSDPGALARRRPPAATVGAWGAAPSAA
jgi:MoaA/NifB/PqqE/SkfB family radical SAM enzyme